MGRDSIRTATLLSLSHRSRYRAIRFHTGVNNCADHLTVTSAGGLRISRTRLIAWPKPKLCRTAAFDAFVGLITQRLATACPCSRLHLPRFFPQEQGPLWCYGIMYAISGARAVLITRTTYALAGVQYGREWWNQTTAACAQGTSAITIPSPEVWWTVRESNSHLLSANQWSSR